MSKLSFAGLFSVVMVFGGLLIVIAVGSGPYGSTFLRGLTYGPIELFNLLGLSKVRAPDFVGEPLLRSLCGNLGIMLSLAVMAIIPIGVVFWLAEKISDWRRR